MADRLIFTQFGTNNPTRSFSAPLIIRISAVYDKAKIRT